jgi:hypothetical protein
MEFNNFHAYKIFLAIATIAIFLFVGLISVLVTLFYKFHRKLVRENKTTIEGLEMKNQPYQSKFDMSEVYNRDQIFGVNRWLDYFPIMPKSAKPFGSGIYFEKNVDTSSEEEEEEENTGNNEDSRNPANFRASNGQQPNTTSQHVQQPSSQNQLQRPGGAAESNKDSSNAAESTTKQGDVMTIHNDRSSQYRNLNNIVRSDGQVQEYKSNESCDNKPVERKKVETSKKQYINEVDSREYKELK